MAVNLSLFAGAGWQFFTDDGIPLAGGLVYTYTAGSTTPATTYADSSGTTQNANPIVLDAAGRPPSEIWLSANTNYKFVVKTSTGALIRTYDNIPGANDVSYIFTELANTTNVAQGDALIGFKQSNSTGILPFAVGKTVHTKLQEIVSVKDFGAVGDGVTDDTTAVQNAINYWAGVGGELLFPPGTYLTSGLVIAANKGNNDYFKVNGIGATLQGNSSTTSATLTINYTKGIEVDGLTIIKGSLATYATILNSVWLSQFNNISFNNLMIAAQPSWGFYWNEFNNCRATIYYDCSKYTINQNIWKGGQVGGITKSNFSGAPYDMYNNVFIGADILGAIIWTDTGPYAANFIDPIVLRDCNMEYAGQNQGYMLIEGGRNNLSVPYSAIDYSNLRTEMNMQYSGSNWVTGWYPWSSTNLIRGGACQNISPDISMIAVANSYLSIYADATSPTGNGYCYRAYVPIASYARIKISMPVEYLQEAIKVGFVSFSWWEYNTKGGAGVICNLSGTPPTGDLYPSGLLLPADGSNTWVKRFITIPISSTANQVTMYIGGSNVTGFDVRVANVACFLGKIARPYTPATGEPSASRGLVFTKTNLVQNGSAQNTFSISVPTGGVSGRIAIKATTNAANSNCVYQGELFYAYNSAAASISANVVNIGSSGAGGGGTAGTITSMAASASGSTVTVTTTVSNYAGTPTISATYDLVFLDNNETVTLL